MITPNDIDVKEFTISKKGFDQDEVNEFLDEINLDYQKLLKENSDLKKQIEELQNEKEKSKDTENSIYKTLEAAKGLMNDIAASAERRADVLLKNAEMDANLITREAKESVAKYTEEGSRLKDRVELLRNKYKELLQNEIDRLDFTTNDLLAEFERDFIKQEEKDVKEIKESQVTDSTIVAKELNLDGMDSSDKTIVFKKEDLK